MCMPAMVISSSSSMASNAMFVSDFLAAIVPAGGKERDVGMFHKYRNTGGVIGVFVGKKKLL